ncbi:hypothetical protein V6N12_028814 [Hibiscus sabdariffa]|uniref:Uncharacterized protein n=1 Tax=Hibiscus sabdariffa TaxID=183260 RepID=A0ABR2F744_9ROSI
MCGLWVESTGVQWFAEYGSGLGYGQVKVGSFQLRVKGDGGMVMEREVDGVRVVVLLRQREMKWLNEGEVLLGVVGSLMKESWKLGKN